MDKIEETREYFIEKYGKPYEKVVDGKTYRFENLDLQNFDKLINSFKKLAEIYEVELKDVHFNVLCDFAKTGIQQNIASVVKKFNKHAEEKLKGVRTGKKAFVNILSEFEEFYNADNYNIHYIMDIFTKHTRCADVRRKGAYRTLME